MELLRGLQSSLNPRGPDAAVIAEMAWVLIAGGAVVFAIVMGIAAYAVLAPRQRASRLSPRWLVVGGGIVFPAVVLTALLAYSLWRSMALGTAGSGALRIEVTGEQWWWRVHYLGAEGRVDFATANEIRIPAGVPVDLELRSADVIHSFWVPALAGKLDMIPGRVNRMRLLASAPGTFRGQCAEYCGGPHAHMAFVVVAETPEAFSAWAAGQRRPAAAPASASPSAIAAFESLCGACHALRGTAAAGTRGPDLTHVGSRTHIGAGRLPMDAGSLAAWITSSQHLKPGNLMPEFRDLDAGQARELANYLAGLR